jgi:transcriptional regulator with XRE-family HTH domain
MSDHIVPELGKRIREIRQEKELKLVDIAQKAGISKGLLSKVENGRTIPSLPVLVSIVDSLQVRMDEFFAGISSSPDTRYIHIKQEEYRDIRKENAVGFQYQGILSRAVGDSLIEVVLLTIQPGSKRARVTTDAFEYKYMVSGVLDYDLDGEIIPLKAGDSLFYNGRIPHVPINKSNNTAIMLVVYFFNK